MTFAKQIATFRAKLQIATCQFCQSKMQVPIWGVPLSGFLCRQNGVFTPRGDSISVQIATSPRCEYTVLTTQKSGGWHEVKKEFQFAPAKLACCDLRFCSGTCNSDGKSHGNYRWATSFLKLGFWSKSRNFAIHTCGFCNIYGTLQQADTSGRCLLRLPGR